MGNILYATSIHVSAEEALTQVEQLVCFRLLDNCTGWPTHSEMQEALPYRLVNLSEHRFGAHMDAGGIWTYPITPLIVMYETYMSRSN